jgi:hypothetical protein
LVNWGDDLVGGAIGFVLGLVPILVLRQRDSSADRRAVASVLLAEVKANIGLLTAVRVLPNPQMIKVRVAMACAAPDFMARVRLRLNRQIAGAVEAVYAELGTLPEDPSELVPVGNLPGIVERLEKVSSTLAERRLVDST